jgi:hypothetical protein
MEKQRLNNFVFAIIIVAVLAITVWRVLPRAERVEATTPAQTQDATMELIKKGVLSDAPAKDWQRMGE